MKEIIKIEHLHKTYDTGAVQVHALRDVNLTIHEGEYVAIMGQSGSGKSTLMNILGCMDRRFEGMYLLDGISIAEQGENDLSRIRNQKIGFVFQAFQLIPRTSALKNVEIPMIYRGMKGEARKKKAEALLTKVGLGERVHHMPNELSGGQKQRVAIAGVIAMEPRIIVLDEPTAMLDPQGRQEVISTVSRLCRENGMTVVLITHHMDECVGADRLVVMSNGRIVADGSPAKVFSQVELMHSEGLDVPETTRLIYELNQEGFRLPMDALALDACADALADALK